MGKIKINITADTWIEKSKPTQRYGSDNTLEVNYKALTTSAEIVKRAIFSFNIPIELPSNITSAKLYIFRYQGTGIVELHSLLQDFIESEATWNNATTLIPWTTTGGGGNYDPNIIAISTSLIPSINTVDVFDIKQYLVNLPSGSPIMFLLKVFGEGTLTSIKYASFVSKNATINNPFLNADLYKPYIEIISNIGDCTTPTLSFILT